MARYRKQLYIMVSIALAGMLCLAEDSIDVLKKRVKEGDRSALLQLRARLEPLADAGDTSAMIDLAESYHWYIPWAWVTESYKQKAFELYLQAAAKGSAKGMYCVGRCYYYGHGQCVAKNRELAFKWYRKAADHGSFEAYWELVKDARSRKDEAEELRLLHEAAGKGDSELGRILAIKYEERKDMRNAIKWYTKAFESADPKDEDRYLCKLFSAGAIAFIYKMGKDISRDYAEAYKWYNKILGMVDRESHPIDAGWVRRELADFHFHGWHVPMDFAKGVKLLREAAECGDGEACHKLAMFYMMGLSGPINGDTSKLVEIVKYDYDEAIHWERKGAEAGCYESIFYFCSHFVALRKYNEAYKWLEMGAKEEGEHEGFFKFYLSLCYMKGEGCAKDKEKARRLLKEAAQKGYDPAIDTCKKINLSY